MSEFRDARVPKSSGGGRDDYDDDRSDEYSAESAGRYSAGSSESSAGGESSSESGSASEEESDDSGSYSDNDNVNDNHDDDKDDKDDNRTDAQKDNQDEPPSESSASADDEPPSESSASVSADEDADDDDEQDQYSHSEKKQDVHNDEEEDFSGSYSDNEQDDQDRHVEKQNEFDDDAADYSGSSYSDNDRDSNELDDESAHVEQQEEFDDEPPSESSASASAENYEQEQESHPEKQEEFDNNEQDDYSSSYSDSEQDQERIRVDEQNEFDEEPPSESSASVGDGQANDSEQQKEVFHNDDDDDDEQEYRENGEESGGDDEANHPEQQEDLHYYDEENYSENGEESGSGDEHVEEIHSNAQESFVDPPSLYSSEEEDDYSDDGDHHDGAQDGEDNYPEDQEDAADELPAYSNDEEEDDGNYEKDDYEDRRPDEQDHVEVSTFADNIQQQQPESPYKLENSSQDDVENNHPNEQKDAADMPPLCSNEDEADYSSYYDDDDQEGVLDKPPFVSGDSRQKQKPVSTYNLESSMQDFKHEVQEQPATNDIYHGHDNKQPAQKKALSAQSYTGADVRGSHDMPHMSQARFKETRQQAEPHYKLENSMRDDDEEAYLDEEQEDFVDDDDNYLEEQEDFDDEDNYSDEQEDFEDEPSFASSVSTKNKQQHQQQSEQSMQDFYNFQVQKQPALDDVNHNYINLQPVQKETPSAQYAEPKHSRADIRTSHTMSHRPQEQYENESYGNEHSVHSTKKGSVSFWAVLETYFFNYGAIICFVSLLLISNINMFAWGVWEFTAPHWTTDSAVLRVTLPMARGAGRLVTWNVALLLLSSCQLIWSVVRRTTIHLGFPVNDIMPYYHKMIAVLVIFMGCIVHSIPQIVNYATKEFKLRGGVWNLQDDESLPTTQLLVTGCLLFTIFGSFFVTGLQRIRKTAAGFRIFWWAHVVGVVAAMPLLIIHGTVRGTPITVYFLAIPLCLYFTDSLLRQYFYSPLKAEVVELTASEDGDDYVVKIVVKNDNFRFAPGQYAELKIAEIAAREWHPFTVASAPNMAGQVVFYVKVVGRWTRALYELAADSPPGEPLVCFVGLRGPYGAPAQDYLSYKHIVVIGSGMGVTPLLSSWKSLVNSGSWIVQGGPKPVQPPPPPETAPPVGSTNDGRFVVLDENGNRVPPPESYSVVSVNERSALPDRMAEKSLLQSGDVNYANVVSFDRPLGSMRARAAYAASILESMTINICLFCFSLYMETIVFCLWLFNHDREAVALQIYILVIALTVFGSKMILSSVAYGRRYNRRSLVFRLEAGIILLDLIALAIASASLHSPTRQKAIAYFLFFAAFVCLHAVRIFHMFHVTSRPTPSFADTELDTSKRRELSMGNAGKIHSVTGIWVSRHYSGMSFAVPDLVHSAHDLSPAYSLQLYATRDKESHVKDVNPFYGCLNRNHALKAGRPNWKAIMFDAIERAHETNPHGERVGVFFCGSPAIAVELQRVANRVTGEHQYSQNLHRQMSCRCRLMVHKENF